MLKKLKDLLIGMIIGTLLVYAIPTIANSIKTYIAEEATFPILVDGQEVKLDMPVVTIEGRTYLPLRALGDILQVDVDWNSNLNRVEINKEKPTKNSKVGANMDNSNKINVIDEYNIEVDGVRYIKEGFIGATIISKGCGAEPEVRQDENGNYYEMLWIWYGDNKEDGICIRRYVFKSPMDRHDTNYFSYSDYENILLPYIESII